MLAPLAGRKPDSYAGYVPLLDLYRKEYLSDYIIYRIYIFNILKTYRIEFIFVLFF